MAPKDEQHPSQESNWGETSQSSLTALQASTQSLRESSAANSHRPSSRAESVVAPDDSRAQTFNPNTTPDATKTRLGPMNYGKALQDVAACRSCIHTDAHRIHGFPHTAVPELASTLIPFNTEEAPAWKAYYINWSQAWSGVLGRR